MTYEPELASWLQSLQDADPQVRSEAIYALGQLKSTRAMAALKGVVCDDPVAHCRKSALYWLRESGDQAVFNQAVRCALDDADPFIRTDAAWSIRQAGPPNPDIVEPLIRALASSQDAPMALSMMLSALGKLRDRRAFEPMVAYLTSASAYQRGAAAQALGELGDPRAVDHLTNLLDDQAIAWKEDHGPERSVAHIARHAAMRL